ncbi:MAG TPA: hypothetical protein VGG02_11730 [Chthoniobacterales bacterium]|jgi:Flp pilus assembly protein TadD
MNTQRNILECLTRVRTIGMAAAFTNRMSLEWHLSAACGYAELGMERASVAELNAIPRAEQNHPEVLRLRLHHQLQRRNWKGALSLSRKICRVAPHDGAGFLHAGFCLSQLGRTAEARRVLLQAPPALRREPIYHYNMGCYEALLGNARNAQKHLQISFEMDESFRSIAKVDPDLKTLHGFF